MEFESTTMQYAFPQGHHGCQQPHFPEYYYLPPPPPPPPPPTNYCPPPNHSCDRLAYYPAGAQNYFKNAFPRHSINAGGNWYVGNGIQSNGDVKLGYGSHAKLNNGYTKRKKHKSTIIGGCHNNQGGHQVSGDVILGNIP